MVTKIKRWGNSLAIRIPKALAATAGLHDDAPIELSIVDGNIVITPVNQPVYILKDLLAEITKENVHGEVTIGSAVGNEAW
jgi:antitoxin MazE